MNAVEIEEAVSSLVESPFDASEFPYAFLAAFGNKDATLRKLRSAKTSESTNKSDAGGVLQRNNVHLVVAPAGEVSATLAALRASPATAKHKVRFILATDGATVEAEELETGESLSRITHLYAVGDHPVLRTRGDAGGWEDASGVPGLGGTGGGVRSLSSSRSR